MSGIFLTLFTEGVTLSQLSTRFRCSAMASFCVGDYLAETRPKSVFGILSSYWETTTHPSRQAEAHRSLTGIGCINELNCSFAAEGYARAEGVAGKSNVLRG